MTSHTSYTHKSSRRLAFLKSWRRHIGANKKIHLLESRKTMRDLSHLEPLVINPKLKKAAKDFLSQTANQHFV
jgi:hypothetical protein